MWEPLTIDLVELLFSKQSLDCSEARSQAQEVEIVVGTSGTEAAQLLRPATADPAACFAGSEEVHRAVYEIQVTVHITDPADGNGRRSPRYRTQG